MLSNLEPVERDNQGREILRLRGRAVRKRAQRQNASLFLAFVTHRLCSERRGYFFSCLGSIIIPPRLRENGQFLIDFP